MKKFRTLALLIVVALAATGLLAACNDPKGTTLIDYGIKQLGDLTDFGTDPKYYAPSAVGFDGVNYAGASAATSITKLDNRIAEQKTLFDKHHNQTEDGWQDIEQSTFEKIFAHATSGGVMTALSYAALPYTKMNDLVEYMTKVGSDGFFAQYKHMQDYDKKMRDNETLDENGQYNAAYQEAYKKQQKLRRTMSQTLDGMGLDGAEAARTIIQLSVYAETVVEDSMRPNYMPNAKLMDDYFKATEKNGGLFDYDTLVFFKTNKILRGTVTGYTGSADAVLVRAYAYMYQYQVVANSEKTLSKDEFERELVYRFQSYLDESESVDYAQIKRKNYERAYRYSATFYSSKFYPAVNTVEKQQELTEAEVYGINDGRNGTAVAEIAGNGVTSEPTISIRLGSEIQYKSETALSTTMQLQGISNGIESDLLAGDMQYYYYEVDNYTNTKRMAASQKSYELSNKTSVSSWAPARLTLQLDNLRMTYFTIDQFITRNNTKGLSGSLVGQIYAVAADDIKTVNTLKKDLVLMIAELNDYNQDTEEYNERARLIGRKNAQLKSFVNAAVGVVSNLETRLTYAKTGAQWTKIHAEVKAAIDADYSKYPVTANGMKGATTPQLNYMQFLLVKQTFGAEKTDFIDGVAGHFPDNDSVAIEFDSEHGVSQLYVNEEKILLHSAGIIEVNFRKVSSINDKNVIQFTDYNKFQVESGKAYNTISFGTGFPMVGTSSDDNSSVIRGPLDASYKFIHWSLDEAGYYPIDYAESVRYDDTVYYAFFRKAA